MGKTKRMLVLAGVLAVCAMTGGAHAQWATIKSSLQPNVRILEETATRLVLYDEAHQLQMIITKTPQSGSDIYADGEARRGGNRYRVWTTTALFWSKPAFAEDGGKKFFTNSFAQTLRPPAPEQTLLPVSEPPEQPITKLDTTPQPVERYAQKDPKTAETDTSLQVIAPVIARPESTKIISEVATASAKSARAEKSRPASGTAKSNIQPPSRETKSERTASRPNLLPPRPAIPSRPQPREERRSDSVAIAAAPLATPEPIAPSQETHALAETDSAFSQRLGSSPVLLGEIFAGLILLSSFVFILTLPTTRARFLQWRGNDLAAAEIYEKRLTKSPHRVKLYLALAKIYLRMGKTDGSAMKIYKTILQLNLATHEREKFSAIVAQQYLAEGRTDSEALEIIESALKNNRNKALPDQSSKK